MRLDIDMSLTLDIDDETAELWKEWAQSEGLSLALFLEGEHQLWWDDFVSQAEPSIYVRKS